MQLTSHTMKACDKVIQKKLGKETFVSKHQFEFMSGRAIMGPTFYVRQLIEK